jgi:hypothetical protein
MFANAVGTRFQASSASGADPVWLTLHAVEDLPQLAPVNPASFAVRNRMAAPAPVSSGFLLRFGSSTPLPQESYLFQHEALGSFALFIVPEAEGQTFSATVNRLDAAIIAAIPIRAAQTPTLAQGAATAPGTGNLLPAETPAARRAITQE